MIQLDKFINTAVLKDLYHIELIRGKLTRQLSALIAPMVDEVESVCAELLPTKVGSEYITLQVWLLFLYVIRERGVAGQQSCDGHCSEGH